MSDHSATSGVVALLPVGGVPLVKAGDDLATLLMNALRAARLSLQTRDVLVISSKVVSKAEGRQVHLDSVVPDERAHQYAAITGKDPRLVQLILDESQEVSRAVPGVLVVRHRLGFVCANAGIDQSNIDQGDSSALLLPHDPDASAQALRMAIAQTLDADIAVVISDTHGRPFRMGNVGVAIGAAGLPALLDLRGRHDLYGRPLRITLQGYADQIASAAHLVTGEAGEGIPLVVVRGLKWEAPAGAASDLIRPASQDLYRTDTHD